MVNEKKRELIRELKELRLQKGITYQQIVDGTVDNGEPVSLSTVKLVFSDTHHHDHDYQHVLKPIANVLMPSDENDSLTTKILLTRLEYKDEIIEQLQTRLNTKEEKHRNREAFMMEQISFYKEQIQFKDSQIKRLNEAIDRKDEMIRRRLIKDE